MNHSPGNFVTRRRVFIPAPLLLLFAFWTVARAMGEPLPALRIGLDYVPFWGPDTTRIFTEEGYEPGLAAALGAKLGRRVELVAIPAADQPIALASGRADLVIARQPITNEAGGATTSAVAHFGSEETLLQTGFHSGVSVAMPTFTTVRRWEDLAGKTVCVSEANRHGQDVARHFDASIKLFRAPAQALIDLRTGACDASLHNQVGLRPLLATAEWKKFSASLPEIAPTALVVALPSNQPQLAKQVEAALSDIRDSGYWRDKEAQWASDVAFDVYLNQVGSDCH